MKARVFPLMLLLVISFLNLQAQQKDSTLTKNHLLAVPVISRSIETDWSFGAGGSYTFYTTRKKDSATRTSVINFLGSYSLRKQFIFLIRGPVFFPGEKYILNSNLSYSYFPDKFWGLGNGTTTPMAEDYDFRQYYIYLHAQRLLGRKFFAGISYEFQRVVDINVQQGGLFDVQDVKGRAPYQVSGIGASLSWDTRNNTFWPDKGHLLSVSATHFTSLLLSDHRYTNIVADARWFLRLNRKQIIALQAYGFFNTGTDVPIRSLASLGGADRMRGFFNGRYRDNDLLTIQAEYRLQLFRRWSAVAFTGAGDVNGKFSKPEWNRLKYSIGGGLRFATNKNERQHIRIDYGVGNGKGNYGLYLQFGEAF